MTTFDPLTFAAMLGGLVFGAAAVVLDEVLPVLVLVADAEPLPFTLVLPLPDEPLPELLPELLPDEPLPLVPPDQPPPLPHPVPLPLLPPDPLVLVVVVAPSSSRRVSSSVWMVDS